MGEEQHHSLTAPNLWFMTPFANHIWCLDHLDGLTHLSCISRLTKMSKMTNTFYVLLMTEDPLPNGWEAHRCKWF